MPCESASAATYRMPGIWLSVNVNPNWADKKCRQQSNWPSRWSLASNLCTDATTAVLSTWNNTWQPLHPASQSATARTSGTSSLTAMSTSNLSCGQCTLNPAQLGSKAPQPKEPDTSEYIWTDGVPGGNKDTPFQSRRNVSHQIRSACTDRLSLM